MTKPIDPPYFDPITLLAEWRQLATQYDGTEEGERFLRLISSLEQDPFEARCGAAEDEEEKAVKVQELAANL